MEASVVIEQDQKEAEWSEGEAPAERWAPLGAVADSPAASSSEDKKYE